jgi:uncharacterized protein YfiM (DUF2279 family)
MTGHGWLLAMVMACGAPNAGRVDSTAAGRSAALPGPEVRAWQTGLLRPDRLQHASLSMTSATALGVVSRRPAAGLCGALVLGVAKELWDRHRSGFDPVDLAADALGCAAGATIAAALDP